jgi:ATP-dependent DNA ligase
MWSWGLAKDRRIARFIEPMECLPVEKIPEGDLWTYELKLDGYRIEAVKSGGKVTLYSRRGTDLSHRFEYVVSALDSLPDETVIDGEIVALDEQGKPNFNLLQNKGMSGRDLKSWIGRAEQKALLRAIATGGPQHFALTLDDFDSPVTETAVTG